MVVCVITPDSDGSDGFDSRVVDAITGMVVVDTVGTGGATGMRGSGGGVWCSGEDTETFMCVDICRD